MNKLKWMLLFLWSCIEVGFSDKLPTKNVTNSSDIGTDMYVVNAVVYQVGIITNKTDNDADTNFSGKQEAITIYRGNGSNFDLSNIPTPLATNITAQRLVGVGPVANSSLHVDPEQLNLPWSLNQQTKHPASNSGQTRDAEVMTNTSILANHEEVSPYPKAAYKRSLANRTTANQNDSIENEVPIKLIQGDAVIPPAAGIQSVMLPPLLVLNNNSSEIPVPIPNTSLVQYSKVNTFVHKP